MEDVKPIERILIANRGEIARRIIKTCRKMNIVPICVYAETDSEAPFVNEADLAINLEGRTSLETYLNHEKLIDACKLTNADAVHPGYGFLSENHEFAKTVIDNGITWIGPSPEIIKSMGDKLSAKEIMKKAKVPTLPSVKIEQNTDIKAAADNIGYPLLVKASAGGGGKGMRVVREKEGLASAIDGAQREAKNAFGDSTVFLEKWLEDTRHVEVQIIGDQHGNIIHCYERECSIQRRHQKIIEEAPSSAVTPKIRKELGETAVNAAKAINYFSTGTVEFLLSDQGYYFLEVNTRLQVEHPVTEEILGIDLVQEQISIAENKKLSVSQKDLEINGHAIEARIYAEDPEKNFLPSPGVVQRWMPGNQSLTRFDSGVEEGTTVPSEFDPMIAKVISHASNRRQAAKNLAQALKSTKLYGIKNNKEFLESTLLHKNFLEGDTTTDFIEKTNPPRARSISTSELEEAAIAVVMESQALNRSSAKVMQSIRSGWRNSVMPPQSLELKTKKKQLLIRYQSKRNGTFEIIDSEGNKRPVRLYTSGNGKLDFELEKTRVKYDVIKIGNKWFVQNFRGHIEFEEIPRDSQDGEEENSIEIKAPMPGAVIKTLKNEGDLVLKGDLILILEAMKMEHQIVAPRKAKISRMHAGVGDQVTNNQVLVSFEDDHEEKK